MTVDFLTKLLNKQADFSAVITTPEEISQNKKDFDSLIALAVLEKVSDPQHIWCKTCQNESVEVHFLSKEKAYTLCTQNEYAGRDYFNPAEIKQWQLNTPHFLFLFQKALGIKSPKTDENIKNLLWDFGAQKVNGANYHLFFCRNINDIENPKLSIITNLPHSVLFYTGTPKVALPDKVLLIPIIDLIQKITDKGLLLDTEIIKHFFLENIYPSKEGDIELDDDFILQKNYLLFEPSRGGIFKQKEKLPPLACSIIKHLYGIRKYSPSSKKLPELEASLGNQKRVISKEIKRIQDLCKKYNLKPILHKYAGDNWGINPQLSCCK